MSESPTQQAYREMYSAYQHFNDALFDSELPGVLITMSSRQSCVGYFHFKRFTSKDTQADNLCFNPRFFTTHGIQEFMQTTVHEMVHQWQYHFGTPSNRTYHNAEWAEKMYRIGLMASDTGRPGGKQTGQKMSEYVIKGGEFERAYTELVTKQFVLTWYERYIPEADLDEAVQEETIVKEVLRHLAPIPPNRKPKSKYRCEECQVNVWGKRKLHIVCGECGERMQQVGDIID